MGLKGMTKKALKDSQTVIGGMEFFGVSEGDLPNIAKVASLESRVASLEEEVSALRGALNDLLAGIRAPKGDAMTPKQILDEYAEPQVEFRPYGKG